MKAELKRFITKLRKDSVSLAATVSSMRGVQRNKSVPPSQKDSSSNDNAMAEVFV